MYEAWKRSLDLEGCLPTVTDDVSPVKKVGETKDRLVRKYVTLEAAIFLRADKLCEINGNGDNKLNGDTHTHTKKKKKSVGTDTRGALTG